ncbi:LysR family transcriptional regulator [Aliamphritea hakodatensis]|uniref:LysR family transcriptional regulator n=1 Tax=Aliamphritea hakodatensis TaxID=2895352 RepID=UPI0022FDA12D|nr:LysR family transcriptional regulator [Aliamphritea hakodatensis]
MQESDTGDANLNRNLLTILNTVLTVKHVSRAAETLGVGQPKISRDLKKLRQIFNDPLLISTPSGYVLSLRAEQLQAPVKRILQLMEELFCVEVFSPESCQGVLNICGPVWDSSIFLPESFRRLNRQAPGLKLNITGALPQQCFQRLGEGKAHFALSCAAPKVNQDQFHSKLIAVSPLVCLLSQGHLLAGRELQLDDYVQARHGYLSQDGEKKSRLDAVLESMQLVRRLSVWFPGYSVAASFCEHSDLLVTLPELIARELIRGRTLEYQPLPAQIQLPEVEFRLYWHGRFHHDPMCQWVRSCF